MRVSRRLLRRWVCACLLPLACAAADMPPQDRLAQPRSVFSPSRRFVVSGLPPARGMELAVWADGVAERIQRALGPIPFDRGDVIEIDVDNAAESGAQIAAQQICRNGRVQQVLAMNGLEALDQEQAEESLASLLVSRFLQVFQSAAARCERPARAPDWLVVGLTHRSRADLRRRDLEAGLQRWAVGEIESLSALLEMHHMPEGRWPQKADAMLLVQWLLDSPRGAALVLEAFRADVEGRRPDAVWWAERLVGKTDVGAAERAWDLWLAHQHGARRLIGAGNAVDLTRLTTVPVDELGAVRGPAALAGAPISALMAHRNETWARQLAVRLALKIRLAAIGQEEEVVALAEAGARYLEAVARAESRRKISALWKEAEARQRALETLVETRRRYLDLVEARLAVGPEAVNAAQLYLDAVERRLAVP